MIRLLCSFPSARLNRGSAVTLPSLHRLLVPGSSAHSRDSLPNTPPSIEGVVVHPSSCSGEGQRRLDYSLAEERGPEVRPWNKILLRSNHPGHDLSVHSRNLLHTVKLLEMRANTVNSRLYRSGMCAWLSKVVTNNHDGWEPIPAPPGTATRRASNCIRVPHASQARTFTAQILVQGMSGPSHQ